MMNFKVTTMAFALAALFVGSVTAQEEEFDPREAIKQIKKDLDTSVENLAELSGSSVSAEEGKRVVENIDKLLQGMQKSQNSVVSNIDELLQKMKQQKSKKSSSSSSSSSKGKGQQSQSSKPSGKGQKQPRGARRDRNNERKNGGKPQQEGGKKPESGKPEGESDPKGGKKGDGDLRNNQSGRKAPGSGREEVPVKIDAEGWGHLPPEVRQLLIDKNFRDYFPDYEREISDYLKSLNRRKR